MQLDPISYKDFYRSSGGASATEVQGIVNTAIAPVVTKIDAIKAVVDTTKTDVTTIKTDVAVIKTNTTPA